MIISTPKLGTALALVLACSSISMLPMTASAQGTSVFDGSKARVNGASKLGMLTQEIASASCRISAGINTPSAVADMESARGDFNALMAGLTNGARDLGIPSAEKNHVIQDSLAGVQKVWDKIDPVAEGMASSGQAVEKTRYIEKGNGKLLDATTVLASDIIGKY